MCKVNSEFKSKKFAHFRCKFAVRSPDQMEHWNFEWDRGRKIDEFLILVHTNDTNVMIQKVYIRSILYTYRLIWTIWFVWKKRLVFSSLFFFSLKKFISTYASTRTLARKKQKNKSSWKSLVLLYSTRQTCASSVCEYYSFRMFFFITNSIFSFLLVRFCFFPDLFFSLSISHRNISYFFALHLRHKRFAMRACVCACVWVCYTHYMYHFSRIHFMCVRVCCISNCVCVYSIRAQNQANTSFVQNCVYSVYRCLSCL